MKTIKEINIPEIDISEIDAKSKEIEENINYDEVRDRIRQVLEKITDKKNRGKKVSQDTIGKYLFPHLGADSSTQSTMSRFVNGNKKTKNLSDNCPDIKALTRLSQLTGISTDWFLYGENSTEIDNKKKTLRDYARLLFIDMKNDLGADIIDEVYPINNPNDPDVKPEEYPYIRIDIPVWSKDSYYDPETDQIRRHGACIDLLLATQKIDSIYKARDNVSEDSTVYNVLNNAITSTIQEIPKRTVHYDDRGLNYD